MTWTGRFAAPGLAALIVAATLSPAAADWLGDKREAITLAQTKGVKGPVEIGIGDQGKLVIPAGMTFASTVVSSRFSQLFGRPPMEAALLGIVTSSKLGEEWVATISYVQPGHIPDKDAAQWNPDGILAGLDQQALARADAFRKQGLPVKRVEGWVVPPTYDATKRSLAWTVRHRAEEGMPALRDPVQTTTYMLGRSAYFIVDLHGVQTQTEAYGKLAQRISSGATFYETQRYEAFDAEKDTVARTGLAKILAAAPAAIGKPVIFDFWVISLLVLAGLLGAGALAQRLLSVMLEPNTTGGSIRR